MENSGNFSDYKVMKKLLMLFFVIILCTLPLSAYRILYAEQFYKLYHQNFYTYPEDVKENIWYLEQALKNDFVNPLYALAKINNREEHTRYRLLFKLHINLHLVIQWRSYGSLYDKRTAYYYNAPWRDQNLKSLDIAESCYNAALYYWDQSLKISEELKENPYVFLEKIQHWEDDFYKIKSGELDQNKFINIDLNRLKKVREEFEAMDKDSF